MEFTKKYCSKTLEKKKRPPYPELIYLYFHTMIQIIMQKNFEYVKTLLENTFQRSFPNKKFGETINIFVQSSLNVSKTPFHYDSDHIPEI